MKKILEFSEVCRLFSLEDSIKIIYLTKGQTITFGAGVENDILVTCLDTTHYSVEYLNVRKHVINRENTRTRHNTNQHQHKQMLCN